MHKTLSFQISKIVWQGKLLGNGEIPAIIETYIVVIPGDCLHDAAE
jgi:hypothetical protein